MVIGVDEAGRGPFAGETHKRGGGGVTVAPFDESFTVCVSRVHGVGFTRATALLRCGRFFGFKNLIPRRYLLWYALSNACVIPLENGWQQFRGVRR